MARTEDVLTIFLASPGDVSDERTRFVELVADWNRAWSRNLGVRLELLRWEDDAFPSIGEDAQDVINQQLPADFDIFVGLMWARFGTPTGRAGSGTQEEFQRALERYRNAPGSVEILFYFKDAPLPPSKIDPAQLNLVQDFRRALPDNGILFWEYSDTDQFEKVATLHITKHVQKWRQLRSAAPNSAADQLCSQHTASPGTTPTTTSPDDDVGYIDSLELFVERSAEMSEIALRIAAAQTELTEHTQRGKYELDQLRAGSSQPSPAQVRHAIGRVAQEMLRFTDRVQAELPLFRSAADASMNALVKASTVAAEFDTEQARATKSEAFKLLSTLAEARKSTEGFMASTAALPRMTKDLALAKRKQVAVLQLLVMELENAERLLAEGINVISGLVRDAPNPLVPAH